MGNSYRDSVAPDATERDGVLHGFHLGCIFGAILSHPIKESSALRSSSHALYVFCGEQLLARYACEHGNFVLVLTRITG
jgi:hypothetical protein